MRNLLVRWTKWKSLHTLRGKVQFTKFIFRSYKPRNYGILFQTCLCSLFLLKFIYLLFSVLVGFKSKIRRRFKPFPIAIKYVVVYLTEGRLAAAAEKHRLRPSRDPAPPLPLAVPVFSSLPKSHTRPYLSNRIYPTTQFDISTRVSPNSMAQHLLSKLCIHSR